MDALVEFAVDKGVEIPPPAKVRETHHGRGNPPRQRKLPGR
jgi:hypothetical protein